MINVAITDDQALVRQGIASLLSLTSSINLRWQAENGAQTEALLARSPVDVLLMDIRMPVQNGIETLNKLRQQGNDTKVIMLTTFDDPDLFVASMQAGANGFLLKDVDSDKLQQAIEAVHQGATLAEPVLLNQLNQEHLSTFADNNIEPLSERELDILRLIAGGFSNKEIAQSVFLAEGTVKNHVSSILAKLNTRDRTRAVLKAMSAKIL